MVDGTRLNVEVVENVFIARVENVLIAPPHSSVSSLAFRDAHGNSSARSIGQPKS